MEYKALTLAEIYQILPNKQHCFNYLEKIRWDGHPQCPHCYSFRSTPMPKELRYRCNSCHTSYSVIVRTIFHRTHVELQKWFYTISLLSNRGELAISGRKLAHSIDVNKITAMAMINKIETHKLQERALYRKIIEGLENEVPR